MCKYLCVDGVLILRHQLCEFPFLSFQDGKSCITPIVPKSAMKAQVPTVLNGTLQLFNYPLLTNIWAFLSCRSM